MIKIITDIEELKKPCELVTDMKEGEEIANNLFKVLTDNKLGWGLSANQIGINKQVCVIKINNPVYLINPRIVESEGSIIYLESCISFPRQVIRTKRFGSVTVEADNVANKLYFDGTGIPQDEIMNNMDVLETIVVQHEMGHLQGKTMHDFEYKLHPIRVNKLYTRNDKIHISKNSESKIIKFKHYEEYESDGWKISNSKSSPKSNKL